MDDEKGKESETKALAEEHVSEPGVIFSTFAHGLTAPMRHVTRNRYHRYKPPPVQYFVGFVFLPLQLLMRGIVALSRKE